MLNPMNSVRTLVMSSGLYVVRITVVNVIYRFVAWNFLLFQIA